MNEFFEIVISIYFILIIFELDFSTLYFIILYFQERSRDESVIKRIEK